MRVVREIHWRWIPVMDMVTRTGTATVPECLKALAEGISERSEWTQAVCCANEVITVTSCAPSWRNEFLSQCRKSHVDIHVDERSTA